MGTLIAGVTWIAIGWVLWELLFRGIYMAYKYGEPKPIPVSEKMREEYAFLILEKKLKYPARKDLFYDENGVITVEGKYGYYGVELENNTLIVSRGGKTHKLNVEEAACIEGYITKVFNPKAAINAHKMYKQMISHRRRYFFVQALPVIAVLAILLFSNESKGLIDEWKSNSISRSYLTAYSSHVTVGDALDSFFADGEWSRYGEGGVEYVDYTGRCLFADEEVSVLIRFWNSGDEFRVDKVMIDGVEVSYITECALLEKVYEEYE